jgi:hypothetical protein
VFSPRLRRNRCIATRLLLWSIAALLSVASAKSEVFCALTVQVLFQDGSPARLQPARLTDPSGKIVFDEQIENSSFSICDFGIGAHKLTVGYGFCYPVTISGIRLRLGRPIHLVVRLNQCPPDE